MGAFAKLNMGGYEGDTWKNRSLSHSKRGIGFEQVLAKKQIGRIGCLMGLSFR